MISAVTGTESPVFGPSLPPFSVFSLSVSGLCEDVSCCFVSVSEVSSVSSVSVVSVVSSVSSVSIVSSVSVVASVSEVFGVLSSVFSIN